MQRFLKKLGTNELRLYGWTPTLAIKKDMIECDWKGNSLASKEPTQTEGLSVAKAFDLGQSFRMTGEKTLKTWIEENTVEINAAGIDIQGLIINKWRKHFVAKPLPDVCTFIVSGEIGVDKPEVVDETNPGIDMEA